MLWLKDLLDQLLPPRCCKCGRVLTQDAGLCDHCLNEITFISGPYCRRCGYPLESAAAEKALLCASCLRRRRSPFRLSRSACIYDEASKPLILDFKFRDRTDNAGLLARMLWVAGGDIWNKGADLLMPVPLHYTRLFKRRYNQSALLVKELHRLSHLPADYASLARVRRTRPQVEFSGHERVKNVRDAFTVKKPAAVKGKRIVLIDDVMTTGSTLRECALALRRAGAKSVDTLTVARVV